MSLLLFGHPIHRPLTSTSANRNLEISLSPYLIHKFVVGIFLWTLDLRQTVFFNPLTTVIALCIVTWFSQNKRIQNWFHQFSWWKLWARDTYCFLWYTTLKHCKSWSWVGYFYLITKLQEKTMLRERQKLTHMSKLSPEASHEFCQPSPWNF